MNRTFLRIAALFALLPLATSPAIADHHEAEATDEWTGFRALGTEPFWSLDIGADEMAFEHIGDLESRAPRPEASGLPGRAIFMSRSASGRDFIVMIEDELCSDGMSERIYPKAVNVFLEGRHFHGCGGETADLLTEVDWVLTAIGPYRTTQDDGLTMRFDEDGGLSGHAGCNRYSGRYEIAEGLTFGPVASTRMACPGQEVTDRERMLFTLLETVRRFEFGPYGELMLMADDGMVIEAERPLSRPAAAQN